MDTWLKISLLLCSFGFFHMLRPSEPYDSEYLFQWFNLTSEEATKEVYPLGTYAVLAQLVIVFLITDMLRYKPIIIVSACAGIILFAIINFTRDYVTMLSSQLFFGTYAASEVAYYTYIYAKVDKDRYQIVTGHTRAACLCGKFLAGVLGQLLLSTGVATLQTLLYITLFAQVISLFIAISLPAVSKSLYFYTDPEKLEDKSKSDPKTTIAVINVSAATATNVTDNNMTAEDEKSSTKAKNEKPEKTVQPKFSWRNACRLLLQHTVSAYSKPIVIQWSIWWALAASAQVQVVTYIQFLWKDIDPNSEHFYNGAVEALVTILGAGGAMAAGLMNGSRHKKWHWWILTVCSMLMGTFLIISTVTNYVIVSYVMYILFGIFYFFVITIASATVAEHLTDDSFGLIFGINTLFAYILQTLMTILVISDVGLALGAREQYIVYGGYYIALAALYCIALLVKYFCRYGKKVKYDLDKY